MTNMPASPSGAPDVDAYTAALGEFLRARSEGALYRASLLGRQFVENGLGPDDIVALHAEALERHIRDIPVRFTAVTAIDALQFLLDVMIAFGVHHGHYLDLRMAEHDRDAEIALARERQRSEDAGRAVEEKSTLLATVAHELRTPITAARGSLQLINRMVARGRTEQLGALADSALAALDRLGRLGDELMSASRDQSRELSLVELDLVPVLRQTCMWSEQAASARGVTLTCDGAPGPLAVMGDADALLSVFTNLLSNAIRYTPSGGQATLTWGRAGDGSFAEVEVRDTGIGMTPEVQGRIFEQFYRAPEARVIESGGLGVGLALVQGLVLAHGGTVAVTSAAGEGSTFRVLLPLRNTSPGEETDG